MDSVSHSLLCCPDLSLRLRSRPYFPDLNIDPYSLPYLLQSILEWANNRNNLTRPFRWTDSQLKTLVNYASTLDVVDPDLAVRVYGKLGAVEGFWDGFDFSVENVDAALQELGELFRAPNLLYQHKDSTLSPSQLVAGFVTFLLEFLDVRSSSPVSSQFPIAKGLVSELEFLVTVLGDAPFEATEDEQVQKGILTEFEQVANEAGVLLHSLILSPDQTSVDEANEGAVSAFLGRVKLLQSNIVEFLCSFPSTTSLPIRNDSRDPLLVVRHLIRELMDDGEDVEEQDDVEKLRDRIEMVGTNDRQMLYVRLRLLLPFLKGVNVPQHLETEFNQLLLRIRDKGCEADYLIKRDLPEWYRTVRLISIDASLGTIGSRLQEMKTIYDTGNFEVVEDCSAGPYQKMEDDDHGQDCTVVELEDKKEKENILEQLVGDARDLQFITIFGMPGIGKTTLAKELYNHKVTISHFDRRAWCVVSQTYRKKSLLIEILTCLEGKSGKATKMNDLDEETLLLKIYQSLKGRRYLIVMDDIWDLNTWEDLERFFPDDGMGSRVLFTSRNKNACPSDSIPNELPLLTDDQCWKLLERIVFRGESCPSDLEDIGKEISRKCHGLPLTAVVVAGVLSNIDKEKQKWKNMEESLKSCLHSAQANSAMQILEFSYKHLSKHLQQCFLYFGVLPEDERIKVRDLKWFWIAEGLIPEDDEQTNAESLAEEYLTELIDKSLVIVTKTRFNGGAKVCVIHDLLRELCLEIAERENFRKVIDRRKDVPWAVNLTDQPVPLPGERYIEFSYLVPYCSPDTYEHCVGKMESFPPMIQTNRWVKMICHNRVGIPINKPEGWDIQSIQMFENLEFLVLDLPFEDEVAIPSSILELEKLKYIRIVYPLPFADDCSTDQITNLEYLSLVEIEKPLHIEVLRCSPHLRTLKCFWDADLYIDLHFLTQLESLYVLCPGAISRQEMMSGVIILPCSIKKLNLTGLGLPWEEISVIGALPNLESLKLADSAFRGETWETCDGHFRQLKILRMCILEDLIQWSVSSDQHFPKLRRLILEDCWNLDEIPSEIGDIDTLQLISVNDCSEGVKESVRKIRQEQQDMGNEELKVIIY